MATEVTLPQLGESVTEGTITAWLVDIGEEVQADQPLFELSSDKIDTEVPAPTGGVLSEIRVNVDETVDVGTVVAVIAESGEDTGGQAEAPSTAEDEDEEPAAGGSSEETTGSGDAAPTQEQEQPAAASAEQREAAAEPAGRADSDGDGGGNGAGQLMSPIVRRMVTEHDLDVSQISASGASGRITREDVEAAIQSGGGTSGEKTKTSPQPQRRAPLQEGARERVEDLSRIRQRIAAKMMESIQSSAQLTTVQEADVTRIMQQRNRVKDEFKAREGVSLSPFVFMARAAVLTLRRHERVNAQADWDAGKVKFHDYVNLGIAVDTPKGLLVPNVKGADDLTLAALARGIKEAADKARGDKKLEMQDIEGGTFTVTNTGSRGVLLDTPILNYPEVAILATGAIKKRPVVVEDDAGPAMGIRDMAYLCLTYDHRLIDGADAARFVSDVAEVLETHDWAGEIGY